MRIWPAVLVIVVALAVGAHAQSPVEIADGRHDEPPADLSGWATHPLVQQAAAAAREHWRGRDPSYEEDFRVFGVAEGAFTQPRSEQQAILFVMSPWPRCCPKTGLAIVEGGRLLRNVAFEGIAQELAAVPDLDGDGRDELVFTGGFGMGGEISRGVTLLEFEGDSLAEWGSTSIYEGTCGAGRSGTAAARVLARPGPELLVERYIQATCETETWQSLNGPEPLALDPPDDSSYIELPLP